MTEAERLNKLRRKYTRLWDNHGSKKELKAVEKSIIALAKEILNTANKSIRGA